MGIKSFEELGATELDVLTEVGNIGSGNATTALSQMLGIPLDIDVPAVRILDFQTAIDYAGGAEEVVAGVLVPLRGDIEGMMLFLLEKELTNIIISTFFGMEGVELSGITPEMSSALTETGNILSGSYVNAIAELAQAYIEVETPMMTIDMLGAIMSVPAGAFGEMSDKLLYIDNLLKIDGKNIKSKMMLLPTIESLNTLLQKLGVISS
ncbi:MAG: chemotaxis protein CheC [Ruminiclostridium sp.]|nr:chemotaxis protein CheC [Ruminiclostridium sp.]